MSPLTPFATISSNQIALYTSRLVDPRLARLVKEEFGISLNSLDLRYQIYFVHFLLTADKQRYERFKLACANHPSLATDIYKSFFATAEDSKYSDLMNL